MSPVWVRGSLQSHGFSYAALIFLKLQGGIGLVSALYDLPSEGVVLLGERRFCHYFWILMEQRPSKFKIGGIDLIDTDLQLVSSQAATVDIRRTKLFEKFVYALIVSLLSALRGFIATNLILRLGSPLATNPLSEQRLVNHFSYSPEDIPLFILRVGSEYYAPIMRHAGSVQWRADESTHWSEGFDTKIRIGNLYLTLAPSPPSLKSKQ
ncbi:hypothetical protein F2Q69_00029523 [Brassica cretica]|uniref:Uncharacterized protein n=1 Tax=Brassica cretica TaxID=69181 RepID=A0A8S9RY72_BRACR|nr:hypothetical protein F2Q69_00029523 [Brassica cretica]